MSAKAKPWFDAKNIFAGMTGNTLITRPSMGGQLIPLRSVEPSIGQQFEDLCRQVSQAKAQIEVLAEEARDINDATGREIAVEKWKFEQIVAKLESIRDQQLTDNQDDADALRERLTTVQQALADLAREHGHITAEVPQ